MFSLVTSTHIPAITLGVMSLKDWSVLSDSCKRSDCNTGSYGLPLRISLHNLFKALELNYEVLELHERLRIFFPSILHKAHSLQTDCSSTSTDLMIEMILSDFLKLILCTELCNWNCDVSTFYTHLHSKCMSSISSVPGTSRICHLAIVMKFPIGNLYLFYSGCPLKLLTDHLQVPATLACPGSILSFAYSLLDFVDVFANVANLLIYNANLKFPNKSPGAKSSYMTNVMR